MVSCHYAGIGVNRAVFPAKSFAVVRSQLGEKAGCVLIVVTAESELALGVCGGRVDVEGNVKLFALRFVVSF